MALVAGARLGSYEILAGLGAGGMGEVYRARDTKLGRDVALKILPESFTHDPERLARFRREAQVLAALNHPHIGAIYGLEEANPSTGSGATQFLILELVDGESLDKRLARGPVPPDEGLMIAKQIAEALETAHEQGIIHRDLKPANIALTKDGNVKVLDFGLAKLRAGGAGEAGASFDLSNSPTITSPAMMTGVGVILGTAAYMSPEQAKGRVADKRSDLWAFGCVVYEMFTGKRAFEGEDVSDTLATVLKGHPDWSALPPDLPQPVRGLIQGCLRKDRRERISDSSTALFLLNQPAAAVEAPGTQPLPRPLWRKALPAVVGLLVGAAAAGAAFWKTRLPLTAAVTRFAIALPVGQQLTLSRLAVAISPDGSRIVYAADNRLFLRSMSEIEPRTISGADLAITPVFSPDGQSLVFYSDGLLKRIAVGGGVPVTICQTSISPTAIAWGSEGILFVQGGIGIMRVSPNGGKPEMLVALSVADTANGPQMLPDGDTLMFTIARRAAGGDPWGKGEVVAQSLRTGKRKTLIEGASDARYAPTGHIVYVVGGTLFAVPFDLAKLAVTTGPVPIVEGVRRVTSLPVGAAHYAFSNSGSFVYVPGPASGGQQDVMLFDRKGGAEPLKLPAGSYAYPRVSPDGKRLTLETIDGKETNISIYELSGASSVRRLTFGGNNRFPIWSADGQRVAFQSDRDGDPAVFWQPADGGTAERLTKPETGASHVPESWSPSGDTFLFSVAKGSEMSLWTFSVQDRKAAMFDDVRSSTMPTDAVFSPDGRWVVYQIGEAGRGESTTYVQPFPPNGTKYQIARGGRPLWSRDGRELFYIPGPGQFMAVTVRTQPTFSFTNPVAVPRGFGVADPASPRPYDITPDGRLVGIGAPGQTQSGSLGPAQIHVVLNWFEELKARVPTR
jgi:Tol biopolymer transport system component